VAMWAQAESRKLAAQLDRAGIPLLLLKGPDLQRRLYGTPAAYRSGDVDVLVPRDRGAAARRVLIGNGWEFERANGLLYRRSAQATYSRDGFRVDLHWGILAAHLAARSLRPLEQALWKGATRGPSGMLEPTPESLFVFLAVHVVGHRFERPKWKENVDRAAVLVTDWDAVGRIANEGHVRGAVEAALEGRPSGTRRAVLDGARGRVVSAATWASRGYFIPSGVRGWVRGAVAGVRARRFTGS